MNSQLFGNAGSLYGPLSSTLQAQMSHPTGLSPAQMAAQNTAGQQSAGGSMAGTVGQGALYAARTRNAGAAQNAIAQGGRQASENLSNAALKTQQQNAGLQQQNQRAATQGLENLYGTELGGSESALGLSNQSLETANQSAANNPWMRLLQSGLAAGGQAAQGALGNGGAWGCWVAAELYGGWDDPRTILVRRWIFTEFTKSLFGRVIAAAYTKFGKHTAEAIRKYPVLRKPFKALFDCALRRAQK